LLPELLPQLISALPDPCSRMRRIHVRQAFPGATIVRPDAMFGPSDALFGTVAHLARLLPALPLIGDTTRLQPVFVEDVGTSEYSHVTLGCKIRRR
jgi:hypothetical protein